jgi:hypothetical protein
METITATPIAAAAIVVVAVLAGFAAGLPTPMTDDGANA